ncbi:hypothetical protein GGF32_008160 [Allomyces javanicus]|nr:hypothetical protein GGF32_008160 [Allomyces javanicus]
MPGQTVDPRYAHSAVLANQQLYLLGGHLAGGGASLSQVLSVNLTTPWVVSGGVPYVQRAVTTAAPTARNGVSLAACRAQSRSAIRCVGGLEGGDALPSELLELVYTLEDNKWTAVKGLGTRPASRFGHAVAVANGTMYVFGGATAVPNSLSKVPGGIMADFALLNLATNTWSTGPSGSWLPAVAQGTLTSIRAAPHLLVAIGGVTASNSLQDMRSVWVFDTKTLAWTKYHVADPPPAARRGHAACSLGEYTYIHGGTDLAGTVLYADMYALAYAATPGPSFRWIPIYAPTSSSEISSNSMRYPGGRMLHDMTCATKQLFMSFGLGAPDATSLDNSKPDGPIAFHGTVAPLSTLHVYSIEPEHVGWAESYTPLSAPVVGDEVPSGATTTTGDDGSGLSVPVIAGIAVACFAVVVACVVAFILYRQRHRDKQEQQEFSSAITAMQISNKPQSGTNPATYVDQSPAIPPAVAPVLSPPATALSRGPSMAAPTRPPSRPPSRPMSAATGDVNILYMGPAQPYPPIVTTRPVVPVVGVVGSMHSPPLGASPQPPPPPISNVPVTTPVPRRRSSGSGSMRAPSRVPTPGARASPTVPPHQAVSAAVGGGASGPAPGPAPPLAKDLDDAASIASVESGIQFA